MVITDEHLLNIIKKSLNGEVRSSMLYDTNYGESILMLDNVLMYLTGEIGRKYCFNPTPGISTVMMEPLAGSTVNPNICPEERYDPCWPEEVSDVQRIGIEDKVFDIIRSTTLEIIEKYGFTPSTDFTNLSSFYKDGGIKFYSVPLYYFGDNLILCMNPTKGFLDRVIFTKSSESVVREIIMTWNKMNCELAKMIKENDRTYKITQILAGGNGLFFEERTSPYKFDIDLELEFNEDLPSEEIEEFLNSRGESGILLFHGKPGTGKTSYIRYLCHKYRDLPWFTISPSNILTYRNQFNEIVCRNNGIFIVEDCECLLKKRDQLGSTNLELSDILNMTDGILGDCCNCKFIFTYNTDQENIDKAILRKGRLKYDYEFKPLAGEKLKSLAKTLEIEIPDADVNRGLSLAEIYNWNKENGISQSTVKIGF